MTALWIFGIGLYVTDYKTNRAVVQSVLVKCSKYWNYLTITDLNKPENSEKFDTQIVFWKLD